MDHEAICDCPFRSCCATFSDPLIDDGRKGPDGMGCLRQSDVYRTKHCKTFCCTYLSTVLSDVLKQPAGGPARPNA